MRKRDSKQRGRGEKKRRVGRREGKGRDSCRRVKTRDEDGKKERGGRVRETEGGH